MEDEGGGLPYGPGLESWLEETPGFNVERIRAPVRLISESSSGANLLYRWEIFARLRHLKRPVEFYLVPDVEHGSHNLQNPAQIHAVKESTVDWFDFWLNAWEDPHPAKSAQYVRWRELRRLRDDAIKIPRPPLLDWSSAPRPQAEKE